MMQSNHISSEKLAELLNKARTAPKVNAMNAMNAMEVNVVELQLHSQSLNGTSITLNEEQTRFINLATQGESCILIGAAGTGKTTCMRATIEALIREGKAGVFTGQHKYLTPLTPGIVAVSFTRRATNNLKKAMPQDMKHNCITIHKLLEYQPTYYSVIDDTTGEERKTMKFEATRNSFNPLNSSIHTIIIDESSMVSCELFNEMMQALPHNPQIIFLGDIQQLPPVFGSAILGYKLQELPTVELTQVYRQALESPIIKLAHRILSGNTIPSKEFQDWKSDQLTIHPWKKKINGDNAVLTLAKFFTQALDTDEYNPETDMILLPFNKACGTLELNKWLAWHIAKKAKSPVYEIIAGFNKHYYSVGDKVLYDKEDAIITKISFNAEYSGNKIPKQHSLTLDYWGTDSEANSNSDLNKYEDEMDILLAQAATTSGDEDRVKIASHVIELTMQDSKEILCINTASEINSLLLGYALTVHKSQGSEWDKVFLCLHQSHATMLQRELLYTAVTRAKKELYIICEPESFINGIKSQRIKGNTLKEKAEYFKGKIDNPTS